MGVVVACAQCGAQLRAKDEYAGKSVRCPYCHTVNRLPARPNTTPELLDLQLCPICRKGVASNEDAVKGPQAVLYHRECFEIERARWRSHQAARVANPGSAIRSATPAKPATPTARPAPAAVPTRPAPSPLPAASGSSSGQLAPLDWPMDLRQLMDDWDEHSPGGLTEEVPPPLAWPGQGLLRRNGPLGKLLILLLALGMPLLVLGIALALFWGENWSAPEGKPTATVPTSATPASAEQPATSGYVAVAGMNLWLPLPTGFVSDATLPGLRNAEADATVAVSQTPRSFAEVRETLTAQAFAERGLKLFARRPETIAGDPGLMLQVQQGQAGSKRMQWLAVFGNEQRTFTVTASFPEKSTPLLSEPLRRTLLAARATAP